MVLSDLKHEGGNGYTTGPGSFRQVLNGPDRVVFDRVNKVLNFRIE